MSDLRKAAEMALGDLEDLHKNHGVTCASSMAALRAALAEPDEVAAAVEAEREACARVCDHVMRKCNWIGEPHPDWYFYRSVGAQECSVRIRARSKP